MMSRSEAGAVAVEVIPPPPERSRASTIREQVGPLAAGDSALVPYPEGIDRTLWQRQVATVMTKPYGKGGTRTRQEEAGVRVWRMR